ncbi:CG9542, partial [Drosophila busckii]
MYYPNEKNVDLERDYLPSMHSKRFQDQPNPDLAVIENHLKLCAQHTNDLVTKHGVKVETLRYAGVDDRQVVDVYCKPEANNGKLFVYVHGGYWQEMDKEHSGSIVLPLVKRGYRVAVMEYNLCPQVTLTQLLDQFTQFLLWVFDYAERTATTEIHFAGHSAGAHLMAQLFHVPHLISTERRQKVKTVFFMGGVYDLRELWPLKGVNPNNLLSLDANNCNELSPMLWPWHADSASWAGTQSYVLTAENESVTFKEQSREFAKLLQEAGFSVSFKLFDRYDHFDIIEECVEDDSTITQYLLAALGK